LDQSTAVCYRCFEVLNGGGFCVQSKDFYRLPRDARQEQDFQRQYVELLCEESPESRTGAYPSLVEAIRAFDEDFEDAADQKPASTAAAIKALVKTGGIRHSRRGLDTKSRANAKRERSATVLSASK
jgi:hypothetical protein